ncbi:TetR family transcriptional regulator [Nocardia sp. NBC_00508]|uniref:TetR family transcriptional regulator n=1 Tax=Nocardia sp. NBC_00508 TaxID=2975992 RepID=UPI002E82298A|nr:TetR family transcriptional regulator [Nocardia sp. NBC_00508]WUD65936.1 TetR family transcriptional regulator [Nocardia sp. NBC_00508]
MVTDWRAAKRARTRETIQQTALRLFAEHGYDGVTVERIAAEAGVSHTTFFRYFPTKEDVVLSDNYDPLIARLVAACGAADPVERVRRGLGEALAQLDEHEMAVVRERTRLMLSAPALRARQWENQASTQRLLEEVLRGEGRGPVPLAVRVTAAACTAALATAVTVWAEDDDADLAATVDAAFAALEGNHRG